MSTQIPKKPPRDALFSEIGARVEDHIAWYHHMQETQPIRYRPEYDLWEVFRYKDAQQVLSDYATFAVEGSLPEGWLGALGKVDPPQHRQVRGLVSKAFTPRRVQELTPRLIQIVDGWLERALARGKMDVASELAYPLPSRVIAEILGLPPQDQERFHQWAYQLIRHVMGITHADMSEILQYFSDLTDERKRNPHDDLISGLMAAEENGAHLTHEEIIYLCLELMVAGNVTTTILLNRAPYRFCLHPEIYQALRADPSLIPGAIEETLRHDFSRSNVWRTA